MILIAATLLPMILSDYYQREISLWWLIAFSVVQVWFYGTDNITFNLLLLLFMFCGTWFYISQKTEISNSIGVGDILFICSLSPYFTLKGFVWFLIIGFFLSLFYRSTTIPLVTTIGSLYLILIIYEEILHNTLSAVCLPFR